MKSNTKESIHTIAEVLFPLAERLSLLLCCALVKLRLRFKAAEHQPSSHVTPYAIIPWKPQNHRIRLRPKPTSASSSFCKQAAKVEAL